MKSKHVSGYTRSKPERPLAFYWKTLELSRADYARRLKETEYLADELEKALAGETRETLQRMKETY